MTVRWRVTCRGGDRGAGARPPCKAALCPPETGLPRTASARAPLVAHVPERLCSGLSLQRERRSLSGKRYLTGRVFARFASDTAHVRAVRTPQHSHESHRDRTRRVIGTQTRATRLEGSEHLFWMWIVLARSRAPRHPARPGPVARHAECESARAAALGLGIT